MRTTFRRPPASIAFYEHVLYYDQHYGCLAHHNNERTRSGAAASNQTGICRSSRALTAALNPCEPYIAFSTKTPRSPSMSKNKY